MQSVNMKNQRMVGGANCGRGFGGRFVGRFNPRGRRGFMQDMQGRGRGRGIGKGAYNNEDDYYIPKKVLGLTPKQRAMIFRGRDEMRNKRTNEGNMPNDSRNIKAVKAGETQEENVNMNSNAVNNTNAESASAHFGQRSLNNKNQKQSSMETYNRCTVSHTKSETKNKLDYQGRFRLEIDSRADTMCCGKGFIRSSM
jgi:hypothetical protein